SLRPRETAAVIDRTEMVRKNGGAAFEEAQWRQRHVIGGIFSETNIKLGHRSPAFSRHERNPMESRGNIATIASPTKSAQHVVRDRPYALGWVNAPDRAGRITATPNGGANRPTAHLSSTSSQAAHGLAQPERVSGGAATRADARALTARPAANICCNLTELRAKALKSHRINIFHNIPYANHGCGLGYWAGRVLMLFAVPHRRKMGVPPCDE